MFMLTTMHLSGWNLPALEEYEFTNHHRPGKSHTNVDGPSH